MSIKSTKLYETVQGLMSSNKGLLAADESDATAGKRLSMVHLPNEPDNRRKFRELIFTAPKIEEYVSGIIMYDSSIRNTTRDKIPFPDVLLAKGIIPGIKVDRGTVELQGFKGEFVTRGLDDLTERFTDYYNLGARFAKWRAVIHIGESMPSDQCLESNAYTLTRYAQLAQSAGLVPIVEPEVIYDGDHDLATAEMVTTKTLQVVFNMMQRYAVDLSGVILKSSMVLAGRKFDDQTTPDEVANATIRTFSVSVPHSIGGIVFLSGGQTPKQAILNLNAICSKGQQPWQMTFSFSRAIEEPMLQVWKGRDENKDEAQAMLLHTVKMNSLALQGKYDPKKDKKLAD